MTELKFVASLLGQTAAVRLVSEAREGWVETSLIVSEEIKGLQKIFPKVPERLELELHSRISQNALEKLFAGEAPQAFYEGFSYRERIHHQTKVWHLTDGRLIDDQGETLAPKERWIDLPTFVRFFNELSQADSQWHLLIGRQLYEVKIDWAKNATQVIYRNKVISIKADEKGVASLEYKIMPFVQLKMRRES